MIGLADTIDKILDIEVEDELNDKDIYKALLYSYYYVFRDYPELTYNQSLEVDGIRCVVTNNFIHVLNGYDPLITFYFLNKKDLENTDFGTFFQLYIHLLKKNKEFSKEDISAHVYSTLVKKLRIYSDREEV